MIDQKYKTIYVVTGKDEACLRIEDKDSVTGILNLCWLNENELGKLIRYLTKAKEDIENRRTWLEDISRTTDFSRLYREFDHKFNKCPIDMTPSSAFGCALSAGLIDEDVYDAAEKHYGRLWNYAGD